jgi:hypothetical protein
MIDHLVCRRPLVYKWDLFADDPMPAGGPCALKLSVSAIAFRQLVSALDGHTVAITNEDIGGLSLL